jgi:2-polyprenyl-3-methyl-5-hydroxy-6-metoxy-1,4-benzoquinol methylase
MSIKDCTVIKRCRLCESTKISKVLDLGFSPLANSYSKKKKEKIKKYPLKLNLCNSCGHLQLGHSINPQILFSKYLYQTNTSKKNYIHFKKYASKVSKLNKRNNFKILDIASNDGTFLSFFSNKNFRLGIDPAKNLKKIANKKGINQIVNFFSLKQSHFIKKKFGTFDVITANHVCAHVRNLDDFFRGVLNLLERKGLFIFEVSYRGSVLKKNTFDTIYHEHLDYHALKPLIKFAQKFNLQVFDFEITEAQGGSLRLYLRNHESKIKNSNKNLNKIEKFILKENKFLRLFEKKRYKIFKDKITDVKLKLKKIISYANNNNLTIAGYGAAAKTTTFLNYFNISDDSIKFIVDDNPLKQGLYMPGRNIKIIGQKDFNKEKIDILLIFAWNYSDYIIKNNILFRKKAGKFLIPFPKPRIVL